MAELAVAPPSTAAPTGGGARTPVRSGAARGGSWGLRGLAVVYVSLLVLLPVVALVWRTFEHGFGTFFTDLTASGVGHAFEVSFVVAAWAVVLNTAFGIGAALLLARYRFPGKRLLSAFIDLPVAVSPIVVGLALVLVYGYGGVFGSSFTDGPIQVIGAKTGMVLATAFVSFPLVVRAVLPVLQHAGRDQELAAASLGASPLTVFRRITLPTIRGALTYGVVLSTARALGEFGAVLVVSNNIVGRTETASLYVNNQVTQDMDYQGAYTIAFVLMAIAIVAIVVSAYIRRRQARA